MQLRDVSSPLREVEQLGGKGRDCEEAVPHNHRPSFTSAHGVPSESTLMLEYPRAKQKAVSTYLNLGKVLELKLTSRGELSQGLIPPQEGQHPAQMEVIFAFHSHVG